MNKYVRPCLNGFLHHRQRKRPGKRMSAKVKEIPLSERERILDENLGKLGHAGIGHKIFLMNIAVKRLFYYSTGRNR